MAGDQATVVISPALTVFLLSLVCLRAQLVWANNAYAAILQFGLTGLYQHNTKLKVKKIVSWWNALVEFHPLESSNSWDY